MDVPFISRRHRHPRTNPLLLLPISPLRQFLRFASTYLPLFFQILFDFKIYLLKPLRGCFPQLKYLDFFYTRIEINHTLYRKDAGQISSTGLARYYWWLIPTWLVFFTHMMPNLEYNLHHTDSWFVGAIVQELVTSGGKTPASYPGYKSFLAW